MREQLEQHRRLTALVGEALLKVEPLFPDDDEPDLATLYQVDLCDDADVDEIAGRLCHEDDVEYAHEPAERKPI